MLRCFDSSASGVDGEKHFEPETQQGVDKWEGGESWGLKNEVSFPVWSTKCTEVLFLQDVKCEVLLRGNKSRMVILK